MEIEQWWQHTVMKISADGTIVIFGGRKEADGALITIRPDGAMEYGAGYAPDEAARAFWEALEQTGATRAMGMPAFFETLKRLIETRQLAIQLNNCRIGEYTRHTFIANATSWAASGGPITIAYDQAITDEEWRRAREMDEAHGQGGG